MDNRSSRSPRHSRPLADQDRPSHNRSDAEDYRIHPQYDRLPPTPSYLPSWEVNVREGYHHHHHSDHDLESGDSLTLSSLEGNFSDHHHRLGDLYRQRHSGFLANIKSDEEDIKSDEKDYEHPRHDHSYHRERSGRFQVSVLSSGCAIESLVPLCGLSACAPQLPTRWESLRT